MTLTWLSGEVVTVVADCAVFGVAVVQCVLAAVAAWTRWLMGPDISINVSVTWSTTESATQRSNSSSLSHMVSAVWSKVALYLIDSGLA